MHRSATEPAALAHGVSVVLPVYRGENEVGACLASLAAQTLDPARFEVVVVINGEPDGTARVLADFRARHPKLDIRVVTSGSPGAGRARNAGLAAARFAFSAFVDHDDYVSPSFLESLLDQADDDVVSIAALVDVLPDGDLDEENVINSELRRFAGRTCTPAEIPRALSFNAAKLVPTALAREVGYEPELASGEDMVFFSRLFHLAPLLIRVCPPDSAAVYFRVLRENSVSRRAADFGFAVRERLEVMTRLDRLSGGADDSMRAVLAQWISGQADFVNRYLRACPAGHPRVVAELDRARLSSVPHARINRDVGTGLVVAYDFDPAAESGHEVAHAIRAAGRVVDIVRRESGITGTSAVSAPYTERDITVRVPDCSRWADAAEAFRDSGVAALRALRGQPRPYRHLRSFGADPATVMLAAAVAVTGTGLAELGVPWTAHLGVAAQSPGPFLDGPVRRSAFVAAIRRELARRHLPRPRHDSLEQWCLAVIALLADRIVVADEAQLRQIVAAVAAAGDPRAAGLLEGKTEMTTAQTSDRAGRSLTVAMATL
jgi:glycosyltransferase involved in cell wall biosynthesis